MTAFIPAILVTQGGEYRISIIDDAPDKYLTPDGAWGSTRLAGAFDSSEVYGNFEAARAALTELRLERARQRDPKATIKETYSYRFIAREESSYAVIRRDALAWQARQRHIDREREEQLQLA